MQISSRSPEFVNWMRQAQILSEDMPLSFTEGQKYIKVIQGIGNQRGVFAFIDKDTGDVLKSGGWEKPARNGIRGNLFDKYGGMGMVGKFGIRNLR